MGMRIGFFLSIGAAIVAGFGACTTAGHIACLRPPFMMSMVYPIDGATGVPDAPSSLVFAPSNPQVTFMGAKVVLTPSSGPAIISGPLGPAPSPLPTPNSSPSPGARLVAFSVPALGAATTYQISFKGTYTTNDICGVFTAPIPSGGSFTTQ